MNDIGLFVSFIQIYSAFPKNEIADVIAREVLFKS